MSDEKLLTVEEVDNECRECGRRARATIIALAERLARVEKCMNCRSGRLVGDDSTCPDCHGTDLAHKSWQAALRSLSEEK